MVEEGSEFLRGGELSELELAWEGSAVFLA